MRRENNFILVAQKWWRGFVHLLGRAARNSWFCRIYFIFSLLALAGTALFWAVLGARLHLYNADQLSDPYLFANHQTFQGAFFPGAHTFLLKWPIFWIVSAYGVTNHALTVATVAVVMSTLAVLVVILQRIERRPLVLGTILLLLSLMLVLIPAAPYAGGILPVNMAMLTTRNLEYAVYLVALVCFARSRHLRQRSFVLGVGLLTVLIASDKLFLVLSAGGAVIALGVYALRRHWSMASDAARWLAGSLVAGLLAVLMVGVLQWFNVTHIVNGGSSNPYGFSHEPKNIALGMAYGLLGILTNFGANPAFDTLELAHYPSHFISAFWNPSGLAYVMTLLGALYLLFITARFVWRKVGFPVDRHRPARADVLALSLIWSSVAALGTFVVTNHYFAVDARYLTIGIFAVFVTLAVETRKRTWRWPEDLLLIAGALCLALIVAVPTAYSIHQKQYAALQDTAARDKLVIESLKRRGINTLVGDYWRVLPIKQQSGGIIKASPLASCGQPAEVLSSKAWQPNLRTSSFAYLLTLEGTLTNYKNCSLQQTITTYGLPNGSQVISGSLEHPNEVVLFYESGSRPSISSAAQSDMLPIGLSQLKNTACVQKTVLNVVAHQDDDLLFLSPDLYPDIDAGHCIRTVFLTAGDAGSTEYYWLNRQLGTQAAYSAMLGTNPVWNQQNVRLSKGVYVTISTPEGYPTISLVFLNLPDGGLHGNGFATSHQASLQKLFTNQISRIQSVDGESVYTKELLTSSLGQLMQAYRPDEVRTIHDFPSELYPDHSDHIYSGKFTDSALAAYIRERDTTAAVPSLTPYIGYPIRGYESDLRSEDIARKEKIFLAYAKYDKSVCQTSVDCGNTPTYGSYLLRQFREEELAR